MTQTKTICLTPVKVHGSIWILGTRFGWPNRKG